MPKRKHRGGPEITFDPEARRNYLRGFSERKKQRRAYGLAMQKVKDRNERLLERKERKASLMEQIEQSEKAKQELLEAAMADQIPISGIDRGDDDNDVVDDDGADADQGEDVSTNADVAAAAASTAAAVTDELAAETQIKKYNDEETEKRWGGQVVVTTSTVIPGEDSDDDDDDNNNNNATLAKKKKQAARPVGRKGGSGKPKHKDRAQEYAGSVERFLSGNNMNKLLMPPGGKKKGQQHPRGGHKGKHGASDMKGVGGSAGFQAAQKFLKRSKGKQQSSKDGNKRKKR